MLGKKKGTKKEGMKEGRTNERKTEREKERKDITTNVLRYVSIERFIRRLLFKLFVQEYSFVLIMKQIKNVDEKQQ